MTGAKPDPDLEAYRAKIERELAERLVHGRAPAGGVATVRLLCLGCRAANDGDAHFCASCGQRFNALVITERSGR